MLIISLWLLIFDMYAVFDTESLSNNPKLIAFHSDKLVAETYTYVMNSEHKHKYKVRKIKSKDFYKMYKNPDDLYLVRYGDNYVQVKYLDYLSMMSDQVIYDNKYAKDILLKVLEARDLSKREKKVLQKAILLLEDIIHDDESYVPDEKELNGIKEYYDAMAEYSKYNPLF